MITTLIAVDGSDHSLRAVDAVCRLAAAGLAMERCVALGGNCGLYAVDDAIVWEDRGATRLASRH